MHSSVHSEHDPLYVLYMDDKELERRQKLTFAQAEGLHPLPSQLQLREVSNHLRARLWVTVHEQISDSSVYRSGLSRVDGWLLSILKIFWVDSLHKFIDDFDDARYSVADWTRDIIEFGRYEEVLGFIEFLVRFKKAPERFRARIAYDLQHCGAAYRIIGKPPTIVPISSDEETEAVLEAFEELEKADQNGAIAHLTKAAEALNKDMSADAIRESIHCVESVARCAVPEAKSLGAALNILDKSGELHPALRQGFNALYGYTSQEEGIRHALLDENVTQVSMDEALFMFSACAAFSTYLSRKFASSEN